MSTTKEPANNHSSLLEGVPSSANHDDGGTSSGKATSVVTPMKRKIQDDKDLQKNVSKKKNNSDSPLVVDTHFLPLDDFTTPPKLSRNESNRSVTPDQAESGCDGGNEDEKEDPEKDPEDPDCGEENTNNGPRGFFRLVGCRHPRLHCDVHQTGCHMMTTINMRVWLIRERVWNCKITSMDVAADGGYGVAAYPEDPNNPGQYLHTCRVGYLPKGMITHGKSSFWINGCWARIMSKVWEVQGDNRGQKRTRHQSHKNYGMMTAQHEQFNVWRESIVSTEPAVYDLLPINERPH